VKEMLSNRHRTMAIPGRRESHMFAFSGQPDAPRIKMLLVIETHLIGNMFASALQDEPSISVIGCATTMEQALETMEETHVDVVLISAKLPDQGALKLTRAILNISPSTRVLALGLSDDKDDVLKYIEAGAAGYILKDSSMRDLIDSVRSIQRGEAQISPRVAGALLQRLSNLSRVFSTVEDSMAEEVRLTPREIEVLQCIDEGLTNQEIAARLLLEVGTVKNHVHNILEKLDVSNREAAASYLTFIKKDHAGLDGEHHESSSGRIPH